MHTRTNRRLAVRSRAPAPARRVCTVLLHKVSEPSAAHLVHLATLVPIILVVIAAVANIVFQRPVYPSIDARHPAAVVHVAARVLGHRLPVSARLRQRVMRLRGASSLPVEDPLESAESDVRGSAVLEQLLARGRVAAVVHAAAIEAPLLGVRVPGVEGDQGARTQQARRQGACSCHQRGLREARVNSSQLLL